MYIFLTKLSLFEDQLVCHYVLRAGLGNIEPYCSHRGLAVIYKDRHYRPRDNRAITLFNDTYLINDHQTSATQVGHETTTELTYEFAPYLIVYFTNLNLPSVKGGRIPFHYPSHMFCRPKDCNML